MRTRALSLLSGAVLAIGASESSGAPRPDVEIVSPQDGSATNATTLQVQVRFEAWIDPATGDVGNVQDVDLLLDGQIVETFTNPPQTKQGTHLFEVDVSSLDGVIVELVAHAYQGNRRAGLVGESNVVHVAIDHTPPQITLTWPPQERFGTDLDNIEIAGSATDDFSGIAGAVLTGAGGSTPLTTPDFETLQELDTVISPSDPVNENFFQIVATDLAGNSATVSLQIDFTLQSTVILVDPAQTELVGGVPISVNQIFVVFDSGIDRQTSRATIEALGGRVAGYLTSLNAVLAIFLDVTSVAELEGFRATLLSQPGVVGVQMTGLVPESNTSTFDNDLLSAAARIAYDNINATEAVCYINDNIAPATGVRPVQIAIIDSGFNPAFGLSNELANIFYADATLTSQTARDLFPHGTQVTGIIAGANNGQGNNGIIRNVNGGNFTVAMFATRSPTGGMCVGGTTPGAACQNAAAVCPGGGNCSNTFSDGNAVLLAMDVIVGFGQFDVVNMSFGAVRSVGTDTDAAYLRAFLATPQTLWVASAGNGQPDNLGDDIGCTSVSPAALSCISNNLITVASHNPVNDTISTFSNFGTGVQVSAPGQTVWTATQVAGYGNFGGTSASAPMTAGTAALLFAIADLSGEEARTLLETTARPLAGSPLNGIDAEAAVMFAFAAQSLHEEAGTAAGSDAVAVQAGVWPRPPGLTGYLFNYLSGGDHHIDAIEASVQQDLVQVSYNDKNDDDSFAWRVRGISLPPGTTYGTVSGSSAGGSATSGPLVGDGVFVLTGFRVDFADDDHHLDQLGVNFMDGASGTEVMVTVRYNDQNDDDDFSWRVDYGVVPEDRVVAAGSTPLLGPVNLTDSFNVGEQGLPVLAGFFADYASTDHHIDVLGFDLDIDGEARAWFNDQNDDDNFFWSIDWVFFE